MIVTAGAIDCHVHFICPQLVYEAVSSGEQITLTAEIAYYVACSLVCSPTVCI